MSCLRVRGSAQACPCGTAWTGYRYYSPAREAITIRRLRELELPLDEIASVLTPSRTPRGERPGAVRDEHRRGDRRNRDEVGGDPPDSGALDEDAQEARSSHEAADLHREVACARTSRVRGAGTSSGG